MFREFPAFARHMQALDVLTPYSCATGSFVSHLLTEVTGPDTNFILQGFGIMTVAACQHANTVHYSYIELYHFLTASLPAQVSQSVQIQSALRI